MTLDLERQTVEMFFAANWDATPYGFDGGTFTPTIGMDGRPATSVSMDIVNGSMAQASIGQVANSYITPASIIFRIYYDGSRGSAAWRGIASQIIDLFFNVTLNDASDVPFLRFCPPELGDNRFAQIGPLLTQAPFAIKPVTIPFIRYETR